ncbi:NHS-like protein 3 isoform X2 [Candoia aspera]|uniref:NHS-like protein 3 isoform X2 n=1 Tax=Candoia aspera TaxID=51853 RepID=UPI002FD7AB97
MSGKSAPAAPPEDSWIPAEKENGSPAASPPTKKKPKSGSSSLRRAFSWLRGRRKKKAAASQPGAPPAEGKRQEERRKGKGAAAKAENEKRLSVQYKAVGEQPDNVFFPSTRPPYLEALHIQAQAGLKSLQNQEKQKTRRIWDHSETSSVQSSQSTEGDDVSIRSQASSCTTENATEDALSVRSEMIQRKGSTFRPHDSFPKSSGKGEKRRRERRTTVLGLPQHVQKELGLSNRCDSKKRPGSIAVRASPALQPLANGNQLPGPAIQIPTVDGKPLPAAVPEGGARISLQALEAHASEAALQQHINRVYYDDSVLGHRTVAKLSPVARPKSLAVPWMTTQPSSPELLSPVMSISPQGTYLSKIIPNAILPPMVDVIALSHNRVRTLSRCSLATASPALSVRSTGHFPAAPRSREHSSSSDNWSHSQSTETIVSNASTISSHGGPGGQKDEAELSSAGPPAGRPDPDWLTFVNTASPTQARVKATPSSPSLLGVRPLGSSGRASPTYSTGSVAEGSDDASVRSDRSSTRSVSLRKMKVAPLPPRRTYSLHQKAQQLEAEGAPRGMGLPPKPERRPPREGAEHPSLANEDDVFPPTSLSGTGSLQSDSPACSPDISHRIPVTVSKLQEAEGGRGSEAQEPGSPDRFGRTMSPSSGYSSQSGTPTLHTKGLLAHAASPGKKRPQPKKPERGCSLQSPGPSLSSSSLTSLSSSASDPAPPEGAVLPAAGPLPGSSPATLRHVDHFIIPPHPKVPAPFSPPPTEPKTKEAAKVPLLPSSQAPKQPSPLAKKGSPPPSPPPAYHPPPPPTKKAEQSPVDPGAAPVPSETGLGASADPLWLPPPPPPADEPDLSMADFPPPDEACFPPPPPLLQTESAEIPSAEAGAPEAPPGPQRAAPAGQESGAPASSLSFSRKVSAKILQQGVPGRAPPPVPVTEPCPPPVSPKREPSSSQLGPRNPSVASVTAAPPPSSLPTQIKKPSNGSHPDLKKEPAARSKGNSMPKEDASLPIVTPSLLQMVRLRSVDVDAHGPAVGLAGTESPAEPNRPNVAADGKMGSSAPQKPLRKSLSLRGGQPALKEAVNPLHEAVRLKASTLSSREAASLGMAERRTGNRAVLPGTPAVEMNNGPVSPLRKSPASTASFIFAKSPKKLVVETAASSEAQAGLQKSLVAELMTISSQRSTAAPGLHLQGPAKASQPQKVPPPVAKKPSLGLGHWQSPQGPKSTGAKGPVVGERTRNVGIASQALPVEPRDDVRPPAGPEDWLQSPTAQGEQEVA